MSDAGPPFTKTLAVVKGPRGEEIKGQGLQSHIFDPLGAASLQTPHPALSLKGRGKEAEGGDQPRPYNG